MTARVRKALDDKVECLRTIFWTYDVFRRPEVKKLRKCGSDAVNFFRSGICHFMTAAPRIRAELCQRMRNGFPHGAGLRICRCPHCQSRSCRPLRSEYIYIFPLQQRGNIDLRIFNRNRLAAALVLFWIRRFYNGCVEPMPLQHRLSLHGVGHRPHLYKQLLHSFPPPKSFKNQGNDVPASSHSMHKKDRRCKTAAAKAAAVSLIVV